MKKVLLVLFTAVLIITACGPKEVLPTSITLDKQTLALVEGDSYTLKSIINPSDANNKELTWSSSADAVATVDEGGKVIAIQEGTATITATCKAASSVKATCAVTVSKKAIPVTAVQLTEADPVNLPVNGTLHVSAVITPSNATDNTVVWASDNIEVATIDANGDITALKGGVAYITATVGGVTSDALMVTVIEPRAMYAKYKQIELRLGQNLTGAGIVWASYGRVEDYGDPDREDVVGTWTSADESVVTVANNGGVTSVGVGSTTITLTDPSGNSLTIPVTVTPEPVAPEDWLPGIRLANTTNLYDSSTGMGWFAEGDRALGEGFAPGSQCFHVTNHQVRSETTGTNYLIASCRFDPVDISSVENPALYIRFYINKVSALNLNGSNSQIEITSSGDMDKQELNWTGGRVFSNWPSPSEDAKYELKDGWNTIVLPLKGYAENTMGGLWDPEHPAFNPFNPKKVSYFRWYSSPYETDFIGKDVEIAIDQLRIVDWTEYEAVDYKDFWSGTINNWGAYHWLDELDGHHGVFGSKDEFMADTYTNIWLRSQPTGWMGQWRGRAYSMPANMDASQLKFVWHIWLDDPEYFNNVITTVEICSGSNLVDQQNFKWTHNHPGLPHDVDYHAGWNTIEETLSGDHFEKIPPDIRYLYSFRIVFTNQGGGAPGYHSYYIDDLRMLPVE